MHLYHMCRIVDRVPVVNVTPVDFCSLQRVQIANNNNKKKRPPKKEAGGDEKHFYFFTWPNYIQFAAEFSILSRKIRHNARLIYYIIYILA